jgi:hypothetical protein
MPKRRRFKPWTWRWFIYLMLIQHVHRWKLVFTDIFGRNITSEAAKWWCSWRVQPQKDEVRWIWICCLGIGKPYEFLALGLVQATYYNNHIILKPSRNIQVIHSNKEFTHQNMLIGLGTGKCPKNPVSMDWFKGKSTGNHGFYHQI